MDNNILRIYKYIQTDLERLEQSNLKFANPEKYNSFKAAYNDLSQKLAMFERGKAFNIDANNSYSLLTEFVIISANYEFYMLYENGLKEIDNYQIKTFKEFLNDLLKKLNSDNYQLILQELNELLNFYHQNDISALQNNEIISLINKIKYEILKISNKKLFNYKPEEFLPFILKDIESIWKNPTINPLLKQVLRKYLIDVKLIITNFLDVLALVELSNNPNVSEIEIENALNNQGESNYQHVNENDYDKLKNIIRKYNTTSSIANNRQISNSEFFKIIMRQPERTAIINEFIIRSTYNPYDFCFELEIGKNFIFIQIRDLIKIMREENFTDFAYLVEGIIVDGDSKKQDAIIEIRKQLAKCDNQYSFIIDNLVIKFKNQLDIIIIIIYIKNFEVENLLSFIINDSNNFNEIKNTASQIDLMKLLKKFNKPQYYQKIAEYLSFEEIYQLNLAEEYVLEKIQNYLINLNNIKDKLEYLTNIPLNEHYPKVIEFICENIPVENFLEFLSQHDGFELTILEKYVSPDKKEKIENIIYQKLKNGDFRDNSLRKIIGEDIINNPSIHIVKDNLNGYQAFYISLLEIDVIFSRDTFIGLNFRFSIDTYIDFLKKHISYKFDWNKIFQNFKNNECELESVLKLLYSQNKAEFIKLYNSPIPDKFLDILKEIAKEAIKENLKDSIYFIDLLTEEEILLLPLEILDICCENIEKEFDFQNIDDITLNYKNSKKVLMFIIYKRLFSENFVIKNLGILKDFPKLFVALINSAPQKYLISYYFFNYLSEATNYEIYILTNNDLKEITSNSETQEICDLKIRMYFEYAVKLIDYVNYETAAQIAARVAELGIKDLILEIKVKYPQFREILIDNINDPELFENITQGEELSTKDKLKLQLLRIKKEKKD